MQLSFEVRVNGLFIEISGVLLSFPATLSELTFITRLAFATRLRVDRSLPSPALSIREMRVPEVEWLAVKEAVRRALEGILSTLKALSGNLSASIFRCTLLPDRFITALRYEFSLSRLALSDIVSISPKDESIKAITFRFWFSFPVISDRNLAPKEFAGEDLEW
jgi:hypothetical protein